MKGMQRRFVRSLALGLAASFLLAIGPTAAKMPYFSVELSPSDPVEGDPLVVVVRLWDDANHTQPATWWGERTIEGLLEFRGDAATVPITLDRLDDGSYSAVVGLAAGTWQLIPFPHGQGALADGGWDGYPAPLMVTVASPPDYSTAGFAAGAIGVGAVLVGWIVRRGMRPRRVSSAPG